MPSPFWPWQNAQPTRKSSRPWAMSSSSLVLVGLGRRERGVEATGHQQAEEEHDEAGEGAAAVPGDPTGGAVQQAHSES